MFNHHQTQTEKIMTTLQKIYYLGNKSGTLAAAIGDLNERLLLWINRHRQRNILREMDDHMLKDIGISRADALAESKKPFWRS
jgi:uncharacterized protein YjiS (DUF1127 family)